MRVQTPLSIRIRSEARATNISTRCFRAIETLASIQSIVGSLDPTRVTFRWNEYVVLLIAALLLARALMSGLLNRDRTKH